MASPQHYRSDIDGLRAVAVLAVLVFHAFPQLLPGGFVGVDVFFVISGYLITRLLIQHSGHGRSYLLTFYLARARRIFPALIVVLVSCLAAGWLLMVTPDFQRLREHTVAGAAFVSNILLSRDLDYFRPSAHATPLLHLWSLAIEEQFYLLWPVALWLILRTRHASKWLMAILLASLAFSTHMVIETPARAFFSSPGRWWELMIGAFLAHEEVQGAAIWKRLDERGKAVLSAAGLLLIVTATLWLTPDSFFPGLTALWPTLGAALIICGGRSRLLEYKASVFIGRISYPLYLWHWPLIAFISQVSISAISDLEMTGILLLSLVLATATYWFIETPIRRQRLNVLLPVGISTSLLAVGLVSAFVEFPDANQTRLDHVKAIYAQGGMPASWRKEECFLTDETPLGSFESCREEAPAIAIWGDSHAAALYPGLLAQGRSAGVRVALFSAAGCPPTLKGDAKCNIRHKAALKQIKLMQPEVIVVHSRWAHHKDTDLAANAVRTLKDMGFQKVVVVGPVPHWRKIPHFMIAAHVRRTGQLPPQRMAGHTQEPAAGLEALLGRSVLQAGASYLSAADQLCNTEGCLAWTGDTNATMLYWDEHHLTEAGSLLLAKAFGDSIFLVKKPLSTN